MKQNQSTLRRTAVLTLFFVAQLTTSVPTLAQMESHEGPRRSNQVPGEVLVKFKPNASAEAQQNSISSTGAHRVRALGLGWHHLKLAANTTVEQALAAYRNDPTVELAQPNFIYHIAAMPNDSSYGQQWSLRNTGQTVNAGLLQPGANLYTTNNPGTSGRDMNVEPAWNYITDCSSVTVAVVDTGVNYNHSDLSTNMWNGGVGFPNHGYDYVQNDNDPMDLNGHGTHVAGTIGAIGNNGNGIAGVCWTASIMAVRVLDAQGSGTTANITAGVNFAVAHGARVINMSLGGSGFDSAFSTAITNAQTNGVAVVVAAGNSAANNDGGSPSYPCNYTQTNILCVAALDQSYALASFSNYGTTSVDVGAPGTNVASSWNGTIAITNETFTSGWTTSSTTGENWTHVTGTLGGQAADFYVDPSTMLSGGTYVTNTDDRAYKTYNLTGVTAATWSMYDALNVRSGDFFNVRYRTTAGDPFASGTSLWSATNFHDGSTFFYDELDLAGCVGGANCVLGFQLTSTASGVKDRGVGIAFASLQTMTLNTTSYHTINGTSMASPHAAGLVTLVLAYNPAYTYADALTAVKSGGTATASLSGRTTTGRAINAMGALAYINAPTGLSATVQ